MHSFPSLYHDSDIRGELLQRGRLWIRGCHPIDRISPRTIAGMWHMDQQEVWHAYKRGGVDPSKLTVQFFTWVISDLDLLAYSGFKIKRFAKMGKEWRRLIGDCPHDKDAILHSYLDIEEFFWRYSPSNFEGHVRIKRCGPSGRWSDLRELIRGRLLSSMYHYKLVEVERHLLSDVERDCRCQGDHGRYFDRYGRDAGKEPFTFPEYREYQRM